MMNVVIALVGLYLLNGLIITRYGLTNEKVMESLKDFGFVTTVVIMLAFIISTPIFFVQSAYKNLKAGGQNNVEKSRDEKK